MRIQLKAVTNRYFCCALNVFDRLQHETRCIRQIFVRLKQPRTVRTERTVDLAFDGPHGQKIVALSFHQVLRQSLVEQVVVFASHHDVQANVQRSLFLKFPEKINRLETRARVMKRGHTMAQRLIGCQLYTLPVQYVGLCRGQTAVVFVHRRIDQSLCRLSHQARRFTFRRAHNGATGRICRIVFDFGHGQGCIIEKCCMTARMAENDRMVG